MRLATLPRLLQLASQALPIGGYSHSQGLESAIEQRVVVHEADLLQWITQVLEFSLATFEIPMLKSMSAAWCGGCRHMAQPPRIHALNEEFLATRESSELRAATVQMGYSLRALLGTLPAIPDPILDTLAAMEEPSLPCAWSAAATAWEIDVQESALAYAWSWAENQVLVAMKAIPLGQSAGQRVLFEAGSRIAAALERAPRCSGNTAANGAFEILPVPAADVGPRAPGTWLTGAETLPATGETHAAADTWSNFAPALAILSAQHETQYSRLFRS